MFRIHTHIKSVCKGDTETKQILLQKLFLFISLLRPSKTDRLKAFSQFYKAGGQESDISQST